MQEEVTQRTVALCVEATKLSAGMLQQAMKKVLDEMQKDLQIKVKPQLSEFTNNSQR